jgi:hypothetical protein
MSYGQIHFPLLYLCRTVFLRRDPLKPLKFAQSSRKHKIGRERITYVINTYEGVLVPISQPDQKIIWIGNDHKGLELEIVAYLMDDHYFVIHAMPRIFRSKNG